MDVIKKYPACGSLAITELIRVLISISTLI